MVAIAAPRLLSVVRPWSVLEHWPGPLHFRSPIGLARNRLRRPKWYAQCKSSANPRFFQEGAGKAVCAEVLYLPGFLVVGRVGIEPTTKRLRVSCSTS